VLRCDMSQSSMGSGKHPRY